MTQGQAAVDWKKPENNAKLFAAVLALIPGTPDYKKIAAVFGPHVPGSAISYRLNAVRKEGVALGLHPGSGSFSSPIKINGIPKRTTPIVKKNQVKGKGRKRDMLSDNIRRVPCFCPIRPCIDYSSDDTELGMDKDSKEEESAAETDDEKTPTTPAHSAKRQKTMHGRVNKRVSPCKGKKTDYKKLDDPFVTMDNAKDEDGNNVFGEPVGTESEDTYATDGSFKVAGNNTEVKMEEAV